MFGQFVPVGSGSYTTVFPGVDAAGRNGYPSGSAFVTGAAANKPIPTNDWWSAQVKNPHTDNLFNYPFTMKSVNEGLVVSYIPWGPIDNILPVVVGVSGLNASQANVSDHTDWTVTMDWSASGKQFQATTGIGMPFIYFEKDASSLASVTVNQGNVTISGEVLIVEDARNGADFAVYAPTGSSWQQSGNQYTSSLNGQNYWSLAFLPASAGSLTQAAQDYQQYAYVFPTNTRVDWNYDASTAILTTDFNVDVEVKEGADTLMLLGLLPHQWDNLSAPLSYLQHSYPTVRGELKVAGVNAFSVENTFHGIIPTLPNVPQYSPTFDPALMAQKIDALEDDQLNPWTDSYNEGQEMNRLIQTARIAELNKDTVAFNKLRQTVKTRLEDWLKAQSGEVAFLFYYHAPWTALLGYPAGHGQDGNINDHHFHWGYFIHAAAFMEQFEPGWAAQWGPMVDLLIRDAASPNRNDNLFPFLRNFSPYAGHCWANGFATFPQGNDQESTSESMQFNSSLIHWGSVTGNDAIRDLGIYLYTTEQTAVEEYWFDTKSRNFGPNQGYSLVSRVWGNSYDNGTFWTADIAASYGIELYPIHGGSMYLGHDTTYAQNLWAEMEQNTGVLTNPANPNLWHDTYWKYLAFIDPDKALGLYDSYPNRNLKFGISDAQTYYWLHTMKTLGRVETGVTSDHPLTVVFNNNGDITYVAQNYGNASIQVQFSDGFQMAVPPRSLVTSKDILVSGQLSSSFNSAHPGGSVDLTLQTQGSGISSVDFYNGNSMIGSTTQPPYQITAAQLPLGRHQFQARIYKGTQFVLSNSVEVIVGDQVPHNNAPASIPGVLQAGHFDSYEGGTGQGIAYQDMTPNNLGDTRMSESVDVFNAGSEGDAIGWINSGEWVEYTVDVQQAGRYSMSYRYASDNTSGGGPFRLEADGTTIKSGISVGYTNGWNSWSSQTVSNIPLKAGVQVLRIYFDHGEFNLGKLTFTYDAPLNYSQPVADAGADQLVVFPQSTVILDGTASTDPGGGALNYQWTQVYGPSALQLSSVAASQTNASGIVQGVYLMRLEVDNGTYHDQDEVYIISSATNNLPPSVSIHSPADQSQHYSNSTVSIAANASDINDYVDRVYFLANGQLLGSDTQAPFDWQWTPQTAGTYDLSAIAVDGFGDSTTSQVIQVDIVSAPSCEQTSWNGDFNYRFSPDANNPTITFIPSITGMGSPTCILYYGTNPGSMPGYYVTPNVPYPINAAQGSTVYFYYTYSYPGQGERNNSANMDSYVVGSCTDSTSSGPPPASSGGNITFSVDMSDYTGSFTTVNVNGDFNGWCGTCNPLTDMGSGIWEVTLPLTVDSIDYLFTLDGWTGQESFSGGESCTKTKGGYTNRYLRILGDTTIGTVCYNSCSACTTAPPPPPPAPGGNVTFSLDMSDYTGSFTTVNVNGDFNGWCGTCNPLTDMGSGIWEVTLPLTVDSIDYLFTLDGWTGQESFSGGESCTKTKGGYTNRYLRILGDTTIGTVCYNSCSACTTAPPPPPSPGSDCSNCSDPMYFSGQSWTIKAYENSTWGPGPNYFSGRSSDVYVDNDGFLHLNIAQHNGRWYSTEVISEETMGYGVYTWVVDAQLGQMEANTVLGLFTWDNNTFQTQGNSEVDVEVARWGDINEQDILLYSAQPVWSGPYKPERTQKINTPTGSLNGVTAHRLVWTDSLITWKSWEDYADGPNEIGSWSFDLNNPPRTKDEGGQTSDPIIIPAPGATTHARMNLWLFNGAAPTNGQPYEVIIRLFSYEPY